MLQRRRLCGIHTQSKDGELGIDMIFLIAAIAAGAIVQAGVGIGFSVVVAPVMMVLLGTGTAVPVLLLLNTIVSVAALDWRLPRQDLHLIVIATSGCLCGIVIGLVVYPSLSEAVILSLTAFLLLLGVLTMMIPFTSEIGRGGFLAVSVLTGLATVWAATPGPLMVFGLLAVGQAPHQVRKLVQPIALVAYGVAFALHLASDGSAIASAPALIPFVLAASTGAIAGRMIGPSLPPRLITTAIRLISVVACAALFRRAYVVGYM